MKNTFKSTLLLKPGTLLISICLFFSLNIVNSPYVHGQQAKGFHVVIRDKSGERVGIYKESHALLIGVSDYTAGWPDLESVPHELKDVENILKPHGFRVEVRIDPNGRELKRAFENFIDQYGYEPDNRLLFFFSGHGHTRKEGTKGYLVPADAPAPALDEKGFMKKALPMSQILAWSRQIESRHALFLFDSCFSGTVFKAKTLPRTPPHITRITRLPVRQYITAGAAGEMVPAKSVFTPAFVDALKYHLGDLNKDGYVSGVELGLHLQQKVPQHAAQTPQYGKIRDYDLSRGDFVFILNKPLHGARLSVEANVSGATVLVDGEAIGKVPLSSAEISPGKHEIMVKKEGYEPYLRRIRLEVGGSMALVVALVKSTPPKSRFYVTAYPSDARIKILNIVPLFYQGMELNPGRYHVEVSAPGYKKELMWVELSASLDKSLDIRLIKGEQTEDMTNSLGMRFKYIKPGNFMMGSPPDELGREYDEKLHRVTLTRGFYMQTTEVTQGQWKAVMGANPSYFYECGDDCPVEMVSWEDVQNFIEKLNRLEGTDNYRLPTEAEWEYAACAGMRTRFSWGDEASCDKMMYENDAGSEEDNCVSYVHSRGLTPDSTAPVKSYPPNRWGLYDMHGNVCEWCQDWYGPYSSDSVIDPNGTSSGKERVVRSGSWISTARNCRSAYRFKFMPGIQYFLLGFRLALSPDQ